MKRAIRKKKSKSATVHPLHKLIYGDVYFFAHICTVDVAIAQQVWEREEHIGEM